MNFAIESEPSFSFIQANFLHMLGFSLHQYQAQIHKLCYGLSQAWSRRYPLSNPQVKSNEWVHLLESGFVWLSPKQVLQTQFEQGLFLQKAYYNFKSWAQLKPDLADLRTLLLNNIDVTLNLPTKALLENDQRSLDHLNDTLSITSDATLTIQTSKIHHPLFSPEFDLQPETAPFVGQNFEMPIEIGLALTHLVPNINQLEDLLHSRLKNLPAFLDALFDANVFATLSAQKATLSQRRCVVHVLGESEWIQNNGLESTPQKAQRALQNLKNQLKNTLEQASKDLAIQKGHHLTFIWPQTAPTFPIDLYRL